MRVSRLWTGEIARRYQSVADGVLIVALLVAIGLAIYIVEMGLD